MTRELDTPAHDDPSARSAARTLALVRVVAGLVIASSADVHNAPSFASLDAALATLPAGLHWLDALRPSPALAQTLRWLVVTAALLGALGAYARACFRVTAVGLLVLLALPQRVGAVTHCHHLLWVAALLAVSPCADVWSADAYFDRPRLRSASAYTVPLAFVRALVAAIYFFPGLHKLLSFMHGVAPSAWLRAQLDWKWMQAGHASALPLPTDATALAALAWGAVLFELSMPLLICMRRTRPWALLAAIGFHVLTAKLLFIRFESLAAVLVALFDVGAGTTDSWLQQWRASWWSSRLMGAVLLLGACWTGLLGITQGYPFACYPTFAAQPPASMPSAQVRIATHGTSCLLPRPRGNDEWVQAFRIAGAYGDKLSVTRASSYLRGRLRSSGVCRVEPDSQITLSLQQLVWNDQHGRIEVLRDTPVYITLVSSLGKAPAEGNSSSSSLPR